MWTNGSPCTEVTIQEQDPIMSMCLSADSRFLLVNLLSQEIHLWSGLAAVRHINQRKS
jgi:hypothetical protein